MNADIRLYSAQDIDELPVPGDSYALRVYRYVVPILKNGTEQYISNVRTDLRVLKYGNLYLPVTINSTDWDNSYVCSPYTHYITYANEELIRLPNHVLRFVLGLVLGRLGILLRYGKINKVVIVNNWMLSTNLYPTLHTDEISRITSHLKEKFPLHAILWRSVQTYHQKDLRSLFEKYGYLEVASRQVYLWDQKHPINQHSHKQLKTDEALLIDREYEQVHIDVLSREQSHRVRMLYDALYIDKYSRLNPQFTEAFFIHAVESVFDMTLLQKGGRIDGVLGILSLEGMGTASIFGYDTSVSPAAKLYRRLAIIGLDYCRKRNLIAHKSSGAASFKRNRGCVPEVEYTVVYAQHLPFRQRFVWKMLSILINSIGVPLIRRYEL